MLKPDLYETLQLGLKLLLSESYFLSTIHYRLGSEPTDSCRIFPFGTKKMSAYPLFHRKKSAKFAKMLSFEKMESIL